MSYCEFMSWRRLGNGLFTVDVGWRESQSALRAKTVLNEVLNIEKRKNINSTSISVRLGTSWMDIGG